jgi:hypothetical protein
MAKGEPIAKGGPPKREPRPPADPERRIAFRFGLSAESRAAAFLIAKGYRILFRLQLCLHSFAALRGPSRNHWQLRLSGILFKSPVFAVLRYNP